MSDTSSFEEKLQRLKRVLSLSQDQEIASALGMTKAALSERKRRNSFPDERVMGLLSQYPDLDVGFILTGGSGAAGDRRQLRADLETAWRKGGLEALLDAVNSDEIIRRTRLDRQHQLSALAAACSDQDLELLLRLAARLSSTTGKGKT